MELIIILLLAAWVFWFFAYGRKVDAKRNAEKQSRRTDHFDPADLSMLPERFVVLDVETTGLNPEKHEIIEMAAIRVNRDSNDHETFTTLVQPRGRISSRITEITGLDRKMLQAEGRDISEVLEMFRSFIGDLPLVAFNAEFDRAFLQSECDRAGLPRFQNRWDCALLASRQAWPGRSSYKLLAICKDAGVNPGAEHRALSDSHRALLVYVAAVEKLAAQLQFSQSELDCYGNKQLIALESVISGNADAQANACASICKKIGRPPFEGPPEKFLIAYYKQLKAHLS